MEMTDMSSLGGDFAGAMLIIVIMGVLSLVLGIILLISQMRIFKKAGKNMWYSLIPIYNIIVMMDIIKMKYIELLFILIPIVGPFIFLYKYSSKLSQAFGKSSSYTLGLFFLSFIFIPLLAFSDDNYVYGNDANNVVNNVIFNPVGTSNPNNDQLLTNNSMELVTAIPNDNPIQPMEIMETTINSTNGNENVPSVDDTTIETIQPIEVMSTPTNNTNLDANVEVSQPIETIDNNITTAENISVETLNSNNTMVEEVIPNVPVQTSNENIGETAPVLNAFNSVHNTTPLENIPTIEPFNTEVQTSSILEENVSVPEEVVPISVDQEKVEDVIPTVNTNDNLVIEPLIVEDNNIADVSNNLSNKNLCKKCGFEMPSIVTICPKCGTDNE